MTKKWNLQDIHPSEPRKKRNSTASAPVRRPVARDTAETESESPVRTQRRERPVRRRSEKSRKGSLVKIGIVGAVLVALVFVGSMFVGGANITIHPKVNDVTVQATFKAYTAPSAGELGYELLTLEADGERQVSATGREEVSERAEGSILIYNEFSENSVRLVKNTRFESPEGLIFKITESVVVPGYTTDTEGNKQAGVVAAEVFADGTGESYNLQPTRFTIPGFAGEPEFDGVYAESAEQFIGGFEGERYIIEESELQAAQASLHDELEAALRTRLSSERPAGFILYDSAVTFSFDSLPATEGGDGLATIKERARLIAPMFKADSFAGYIAQNTAAGYEGEPVMLKDPYTLSFAYTSTSTDSQDIGSVTAIDFSLSGNTTLVWTFDESALKSELAGIAKDRLPTALSDYTAVEKAEATIRPFWKQSFPDDPDDISIEVIVESDV